MRIANDGMRDALGAGEHKVPSNGVVLETKICQGCGFDFLRMRGSQDTRCRRCHASHFVAPPPKPFLIH